MANNAALSSALNVDPVKRVAQLEAEKVALEGQKEAKEQERAGIIEQREARDIERETKRAGVRSRMAEVEGRPLPVSDVKYPEYKAPKETLDQLFSTLLIGAMTSTAIGKKNYMGAMQSMIGAMEGYKANRKEQIDQSIKDFDRQLKAAQAEEKMFENRIREAINKNKNDLAAMNRELELIAKEAGHDLLAARARTQPLDKTISDLAKQSESKQKAINDAYAAAQKLKDQVFLKQMSIDAAAERAAERKAEKTEKAAEKKEGKPLNAPEVNKLQGLDSIADELEKLKKDFKPEYASLGVLGFGADLSMEAKRRLGTEEGQKAVSWWSRYERSQAPNRHALFGATLTGNELKNYQSFTAKKSDDPNVVLGFLDDQINYSRNTASERRMAFEGAGYKVPEIKKVDFESTYSRQKREFNSVEEAEAANLPRGTRITIKGRSAIVE